jgi:Nuclease-related domain
VVTLLLWPLLSQGALFILEAMILGELGLLWFWLVVHDGELHRRLGILGETWSKDELSWLSKRGWHLFSNIAFEGFDVDQVLVGPGGIFAIETKFSSRSDASRDVAAAARQSVNNAHKIKLLLRTYQVDVQVTPVLFLWGPGYREMEPESFRKVTIAQGDDVHSWVRALLKSPTLVDEGKIKQAADAIRQFQSIRQAYESSKVLAAARKSRESRKTITPPAPTPTTT